MQGNITSAGLAAPAAARYPIIEVAINVNPESKHINMIWASLDLYLSSCKLHSFQTRMALQPNLTLKVRSKFNVIDRGWFYLYLNTLQMVVQHRSLLPEAPEIIKSSIKPQVVR
jgi:hypothetical protein